MLAHGTATHAPHQHLLISWVWEQVLFHWPQRWLMKVPVRVLATLLGQVRWTQKQLQIFITSSPKPKGAPWSVTVASTSDSPHYFNSLTLL